MRIFRTTQLFNEAVDSKEISLRAFRRCSERAFNSLSPSLTQVLEYLTHLFESGRSYRTINVNRSALSSTLSALDGRGVGEQPLVSKLLKAMYNLRTPKTKYSAIWSAHIVLRNIKELGPSQSLTLKQLTLKSILLLALASFARVSELSTIDFHSLNFAEDRLSFALMRPRKSQRFGPLASFFINCLPDDQLLCPVRCVREYVKRMEHVRRVGPTGLFIAHKPPHQSVGKSTIARWVKEALTTAGVDTSIYSAHSTRGAAASQAHVDGEPCDRILATASCARASTFHRFYNKQIETGDGTEC